MVKIAGDPMQLYWSLKSIPELAPLPKKDRRRIWKECYLMATNYWRRWVYSLVYTIVIMTVIVIAHERSAGFITVIAIVAILCGTIGFVEYQLDIHRMRPRIRDYLSSSANKS